jgi:hypothetical protein
MSLNTNQSLAIQALEQMREWVKIEQAKAQHAFHGFSEYQMDFTVIAAAKTPRQLLAEYEAHDARIDAAIAWVKGQKE